METDFLDSVYETSDPENFPKLENISRNKTEEVRQEMIAMSKENLYFFCKVILGYKDLNPHVHGPMCRFTDQTREVLRRLMLMPRTHYKTTIWTIALSMQDVIRDPNVRILMIADTSRNAERFLQEIQQHFEMNEVFRWLFSEIIPDNFNKVRWSTTEMIVKRTLIAREPTIDAIGALGGSESRHYNIIRADDLITEKAIRSDVEMDKITEWAGGMEALLMDQWSDRIDWVGSRKKKGDLYEEVIGNFGHEEIEVDIGPHATKMGDLVIFTRQAEENGKAIFPEKIDIKYLRRLRRTHPERYHAQYANSPKGSGLNTFEEAWFRFYRWDGRFVECIHNNELLLRVDPMGMERMIFYDPSVAEKKRSSMQAIGVVAKGSGPFRIILETRIGHFTPTEAIDYLFELQEKWSPSIISIEKRGFQGWVKYWIEERAEMTHVAYLPVVEWPPEGSAKAQWAKTEHIRGLQPLVRSGFIWMHEDQKELRDCMEFYPNVRWDDALDMLAQGLDYWPMTEDDDSIAAKRSTELDYLEQNVLGMFDQSSSLREEWDEDKFLAMFDATGYGMRSA